MNYEFLRQLTLPMPNAEGNKLFVLLSLKEIEIFGKEKDGEEYRNLQNASDAVEGIFYVSAADRDAAVEIMQHAGLGEFVSEETRVMSETEALVEHAEKEYYRKRKITMYETLVIVLAFLLYYLIRAWM